MVSEAVGRSLVLHATRSPVVLAFISTSDPDRIHFGHSPTLYPPIAGDATPFDNQLVLLVGDDATSTDPIDKIFS